MTVILMKFLFVLLLSASLGVGIQSYGSKGARSSHNSAESGVEWDGLVGKYTPSESNKDGFYPLPKTIEEAVTSNPPYFDTFVKDPEFAVTIFCLKDDPHVCPLFDCNGNVAGLRISHLKKEVAKDLSSFPYKYDQIPTFNSSYFLGYDVWYATILFTKPRNLRVNGRGRVNTKEPADGLWIKVGTRWVEAPRDECKTKSLGWVKQGFFPWMGNHYSVGQTDDCSIWVPHSPVYHKGRLIGLSFAPFGRYSVVHRDWFEDVPYQKVPIIFSVGYRPCIQEWVRLYGESGFHTYFLSNLRNILVDESPNCTKST